MIKNETIINFEKKELNTKQLIVLFGTDKQKEILKKKSRVSTETVDAVLKEAKRYYKSVRKVKNRLNHRENLYRLGTLRNPDGTPEVKKDDRSFDKLQDYAMSVDAILLDMLIQDELYGLDGKRFTMNNWLVKLGFVSQEYIDDYKIFRQFKESLIATGDTEKQALIQEEYYKQIDKYVSKGLLENNSQNVNMIALDEYFQGMQLVKRQLESSLNRMVKNKIIFCETYRMYRDAHTGKALTLDSNAFAEIVKKEVSIREDLRKKVKNFHELRRQTDKELAEYFKEGVTYISETKQEEKIYPMYVFDAVQILRRTTTNKVQTYLRKYNKQFAQEYSINRKDFLLKQMDIYNEQKTIKQNNKIDNKLTKMNSEYEAEISNLTPDDIEKIKKLNDKLIKQGVYAELQKQVNINLNKHFKQDEFKRFKMINIDTIDA